MTEQPTLFAMPPRVHKKRGPRTQAETCKRCENCLWKPMDRTDDSNTGYCNKHDLAFSFESGEVILHRDSQPVSCDGGEWSYGSKEKGTTK